MHRRPHLSALPAGALLALLVLVALAACSAPRVAPLPRAGDPACARALAAAPARVLGRDRAAVDGAGALAWGDPLIVLRCGLPGVGPTTQACLGIDGADWVIADPDADPVVFAAFGRDPTVELTVPASYGRSSLSGALVGLGPVVAALPPDGRHCL